MLGFWRKREARSGGGPATVLTFDRLVGLRAAAATSRRPSPRGMTHLPGEARTRQRGQGLEFDDLRPYTEGDDIRHIDWNVTARTGHPHTRLYREERQRACTVAVDFRAPMFTGSKRLRAVVAGEIAAAVCWRAVANRDRAAAFVFDDTETAVSRPMLGERGALDAIGVVARRFSAARDARRDRGSPRSLAGMVDRINAAGRSFGAFVLVTGFDDPGDGLEGALMEAGKRGRLAVVLVEDAMEIEGVPPGFYRYRTKDGSGSARLDRGATARLRDELRRQTDRVRALLDRCGVPFLVASDASSDNVAPALVERGLL